MFCGSRTDTTITTKPQINAMVDLTSQHKNQTLLVEGPEVTIRPVGTRRVVPDGSLRATT